MRIIPLMALLALAGCVDEQQAFVDCQVPDWDQRDKMVCTYRCLPDWEVSSKIESARDGRQLVPQCVRSKR